MVVDPDHQRQGAGKMLVKWGTEIADRMGVEVSQWSFSKMFAEMAAYRQSLRLPTMASASTNKKVSRY
jgi:GNAT superfamily N-acetyltransferase